MHAFTSFHASSLRPEQVRAVMTDYLALERARVFRRLLAWRFAVLAVAVGIAGPGLHWIPPVASWLGAGLCLATPTSAWVVEVRRERQLMKRLSSLPAQSPLDG